MERIRIREMGGSDTALVNILEGTVEDGKIHPVGDRTEGVAVANLTEVTLLLTPLLFFFAFDKGPSCSFDCCMHNQANASLCQ